MDYLLTFIMGAVLGVCGYALVIAIDESVKQRECAKTHNVYECEVRSELVPIAAPK